MTLFWSVSLEKSLNKRGYTLHLPKLRNTIVLCRGYVYLNNTGTKPNITIKMHSVAFNVPKKHLKEKYKHAI
jgi:hypothetical protein